MKRNQNRKWNYRISRIQITFRLYTFWNMICVIFLSFSINIYWMNQSIAQKKSNRLFSVFDYFQISRRCVVLDRQVNSPSSLYCFCCCWFDLFDANTFHFFRSFWLWIRQIILYVHKSFDEIEMNGVQANKFSTISNFMSFNYSAFMYLWKW